jgi:hypothetical protein
LAGDDDGSDHQLHLFDAEPAADEDDAAMDLQKT